MRPWIVVAALALACVPAIEPPPATPDVDSDGDTYFDVDEAREGTDPHDPESRIYIGWWPYNRLKGQIEDPGWAEPATRGGRLPRFAWIDQHGDLVDIYDFLDDDKPVVIDVSAMWCPWCHDLAAWLDDQPSAFDENPAFADYEPVREAVRDGRIHWVTVLVADDYAVAPTEGTLAAWSEAYPNPEVALLAAQDAALFEHLPGEGLPMLALVEADGRYTITSPSYHETLQALAARFQ